MKKNILRSLTALSMLSGVMLSSTAIAGQTIEASVDLAEPVQAQATWAPVTGLTSNLAAGAEIGQFDISLNGATALALTQTGSSVLDSQFSLSREGSSTDSKEYFFVTPVVDGANVQVQNHAAKFYNLTGSTLQVHLKNAVAKELKAGHYVASFDVSSYAA